jgi:hypothetical protein
LLGSAVVLFLLLLTMIIKRMSPPPPAAKITVRDTIDLLDGPFVAMAKGVSNDNYALWLGSGISFSRMPGLKLVVQKVLRFLQEHVVHGDADCRFRRALNSVLLLATPSADEIARTDLELSIDTWPDLDLFSQRLVSNYARVLDVTVDGEESDFLLWSGVDITKIYADPLIAPDSEHLCIALLAMEGAASDIASANWDGLIEKAAAELSPGPSLTVLVRAEDTRGAPPGPRLYKFHGCAVKAKNDPPNYRPKLVAQQSQINGWAAKADNVVIANRLIDIATTKRTLMMGLSAQDSNIQGVFVQAQDRMGWPWPSPDLAYVFSENQLGIDQLGLLKNVYPTAYTAANRNAIYQEALIQAFAKPLLVALVLHVLATKLSALASQAPGKLNVAGRVEIDRGICILRNFISEHVETIGHEPFVRELVSQSERTMAFFRDGHEPPVGSLSYKPLSAATVDVTLRDAGVAASGLREMGVGIGLLGLGLSNGNWIVLPSDRSDSRSGALCVEAATGRSRLFFASNSHVALRLYTNGHLADDDNTVVVHSMEIPLPQPRSPRGAFGRTGKPGLRHVSVADLMDTCVDAASLLERFREETAL